jgi:hypothetical protein
MVVSGNDLIKISFMNLDNASISPLVPFSLHLTYETYLLFGSAERFYLRLFLSRNRNFMIELKESAKKN